jgi:FemAB-related protein (PEP-CTERM system-associated)
MKVDSAQVLATPAVSVRFYVDADRERWEAFVDACPSATFFHRIGWRDVLAEVFAHRPHYLIAERGAEIVGVLPLAEVKSLLFGHTLTSLPFAVYGGVASEATDAVSALHAAAVQLAKDLGVDHLELRNRDPREPAWPRQDLYVTFRKPIAADAEANLLAIPRKQRAMVRKAIGRGLVAEVDDAVDRFFDVYADNQQRHGTPPHAKRYFETLRRVFGDACEVQTVLDARGTPVSSVMSFYFRDEVLPYYAGDLPSARELAANDFKYWMLMRRAGERGCRVFDYGRSKRETGSFDFKKNWGFEPAPLSYEFQLFKRDTIPQNNPLNPKYRAFIGLWKRLPRPLANAIGPYIVRSLG